MAENLAITFDNWIITPPDGIIARQHDNLSRDLVVTGTFPEGYMWEMLIWCKGNYNTLALTQSGGQLSTTLTDEDLAFEGIYKMQLRGTIGEKVRHTNIICVKIPCSIDGDVNWPEIPSIYREYLQQVQQLVQDAQTYAGNAETDATTATQAAQTATGAATQAQGYAQTAETASTDAQDAASTAQSAESDAEQHADNAQSSAEAAAQSAAETADKIPLSQKGAAGGVATLDENSLVPTAQLPVQPISKGGTGATTAAQARTNLGAVGTDSPALVQQYTHAKSGVTHNLTGPTGAKVIQFVATADYASGDLVAVNGITLKATDLRGLPLPDKVFVTGSDVIALVPNSASGGSITFQVLTPALCVQGAGGHNSVYRGLNLGSSVTDEQWSVIQDGTFDNLYIGDYWAINGTTYRIAAFDYYWQTGDPGGSSDIQPVRKHHVTIVPDGYLVNQYMNPTNTTEGGYVGSYMYTDVMPTCLSKVQTDFGASHILTHREVLSNSVDATKGTVNGYAWYDYQIGLMTEQNVYGNKAFGDTPMVDNVVSKIYTIDRAQYPLFRFNESLISNRTNGWTWLRNVVNSSSFALAFSGGNCGYYSASRVDRVRPAFSIFAG